MTATNNSVAPALRAIYAPEFLRTERYQEQQTRADRGRAGVRVDHMRDDELLAGWGLVDGRILLFEKKFQVRMRKLGVPMFAHCVLRSHAEQIRRYAEGNSKARAGESPHEYGLAIDLIHSIEAWQLPAESWALIGHVGKEVAAQNGLKLVWGGDWKKPGSTDLIGWDPAHWEVKDWRNYVPEFP